jgi:prophage antirepressor-like protein
MKFNFKSNQVRVLTIKEEPWFVAKDVANVLDYKDPSMMLKHADGEDKQTVNPQKLDSVNSTESFGANTFKVSVANDLEYINQVVLFALPPLELR